MMQGFLWKWMRCCNHKKRPTSVVPLYLVALHLTRPSPQSIANPPHHGATRGLPPRAVSAAVASIGTQQDPTVAHKASPQGEARGVSDVTRANLDQALAKKA